MAAAGILGRLSVWPRCHGETTACQEVNQSGLVNLTWIDDISADIVAKESDQAASKSLQVFRLPSQSLDQEKLVLSAPKSAFVCTDKSTQKRLQSMLRPGDPPVWGL